MRLILTKIACLLALTIHSFAQVFPVEKIYYSGDKSKRINLVILGDGYTLSQQSQFLLDANNITNKLFSTSPYKEYKKYFNVYAIKVVSVESGASHNGTSTDNQCGSQPVITVNNYFGSSFDGGGSSVHRLLVISSYNKVYNVLAANFPEYDQALVITNTDYYGGSGGTFAVTSLGTSASEVAIHEIGHSFAYLADEYWAGDAYQTNAKANMTSDNNPMTIKWKSWLNTAGIGIYQHNDGPGWYKPSNGTCKMEFLGVPFCSVCRETHIEKFHSIVNPIDSFIPSNTSSLTGDILNFQINLILPEPNTMSGKWLLNNNIVKKNIATYQLRNTDLFTGTNVLEYRVTDTTALSKSSTHLSSHLYSVKWNIQKSVVNGFDVKPLLSQSSIRVYPNPSSGSTWVEFYIEEKGNVNIVLTDLTGKTVFSNRSSKSPGNHIINIPGEGIQAGLYNLRYEINGSVMLNERLVIE